MRTLCPFVTGQTELVTGNPAIADRYFRDGYEAFQCHEGRRVSPQHCRPFAKALCAQGHREEAQREHQGRQPQRFTELFVPLPSGGGEMRDLVIGASRLSESELIKIAATGLAA